MIITISVLLFIFIAAMFVQWLLDGRNFILNLVEKLRIGRKSLEEWENYYRENKNRSEIIVSFTTTPSRIRFIDLTLKSLFAQAIAPARVMLNIPRFSVREKVEYVIPEHLLKLSSLKINRCDDFGPSTKLLPALALVDEDVPVLVVDDDRIYPGQTIGQFQRAADKYRECGLALSGWRVPADLTDRPSTLLGNLLKKPPVPVKGTQVTRLYEIDIMQGYAGYLVRPRFFNLGKTTDYSKAPREAFLVDDVWISAHCNVPRYLFPARWLCFNSLKLKRFYSDTSLGRMNRGDGNPRNRNNSIVLRYFANQWLCRRQTG